MAVRPGAGSGPWVGVATVMREKEGEPARGVDLACWAFGLRRVAPGPRPVRGVDEGRKRASRLHTAQPRSPPQPLPAVSLTLRPQGPLVRSPPPLPTSPVPSPSLLGQIPPRPPSGPSPRPPGCPPVGRGGLPEAGGAVFSLVRHPCQKHLVYKLAAASRLLRTALGSGRWADSPACPGRPPTTEQRGWSR